jgi:hypothetical protein
MGVFAFPRHAQAGESRAGVTQGVTPDLAADPCASPRRTFSGPPLSRSMNCSGTLSRRTSTRELAGVAAVTSGRDSNWNTVISVLCSTTEWYAFGSDRIAEIRAYHHSDTRRTDLVTCSASITRAAGTRCSRARRWSRRSSAEGRARGTGRRPVEVRSNHYETHWPSLTSRSRPVPKVQGETTPRRAVAQAIASDFAVQCGSRSSRLRTLPAPDFGSATTKSIPRGSL